MTPIEIGVIAFLILFGLIALRLPIAFSMGFVGFCGFAHLVSFDAALVKLANISFDTVSSFNFGVLPLFILMAHITFQSGMGRDLYDVAAKWIGHKRGGLAMATVGGCASFAAVSASSAATASTMGLVSLPEMKKYKYAPSLATGCIAAGGTIGSLIPPSGMLIVLGLLTELSISKLFMAGLIPGLLEAVFYMVTIYILCLRKPELGPPGERYGWRERIKALKIVGDLLILMGMVLGGLVGGIFTPTESGAVGACGALVISLLRRRLSWEGFRESIIATLRTTGFLYAIFIGAFVLTAFVTVTGIPAAVSDAVVSMNVPPLVAILVIFTIYLLLGAVLDTAGMMALTVPIFFPIATALGFEAIWFAIIVVRAMEVALITPPIGMAVYIVKGVAPDVPLTEIFRGIAPFLVADLLLVLLMLFVPEIVTFLPNALG